MLYDFSSRVALVTGGGSGIGAACAAAFYAAGARVMLFGRTADKLKSIAAQLGGAHQDLSRVGWRSVDISDDDRLREAVESVLADWGPVDHLVNSAADFVAAGVGATAAQWRRSLDVNVIGTARVTALLSATMQPGSTVVNVSSISAHIAQPDRWTYNSTKSAIAELTRCQAMDLAERGIRVNTVSPGWIWTPEVEKAAQGDREGSEAIWGRYHMLRRLGQPEEVAAPVLFLSSEGSSFITGTELMVDGGYRAMGPEGMGETSVFAGSS